MTVGRRGVPLRPDRVRRRRRLGTERERTGRDRGDLASRRSGESPFRRLEGLIARILSPEHWNRLVVVDANNEEIETRGDMEAGEMSRAAREQMAVSHAGAVHEL